MLTHQGWLENIILAVFLRKLLRKFKKIEENLRKILRIFFKKMPTHQGWLETVFLAVF